MDIRLRDKPIGEEKVKTSEKTSFFGNTTEIIYELELRLIAPTAMAILDLYRSARVASDTVTLESAAG